MISKCRQTIFYQCNTMERLSKRSVCQIQSSVRIYFQQGKRRILRHYVHEGKDLFLLIKELNEVNLDERLWTLSNRQSIWWFQSVDKRYFYKCNTMERLSKRSVCQIRYPVEIDFQQGKGRVSRYLCPWSKRCLYSSKSWMKWIFDEGLWMLFRHQSIW